MKTIEPVNIWINGQVLVASILNTYATGVILNSSASFAYILLDEYQAPLTNGTLVMSGDAYTQWQSDNYAWDWVAAQLNLTITGDFLPPNPPSPEPIVEPTNSEETIA
jgi:hypothetical protein